MLKLYVCLASVKYTSVLSICVISAFLVPCQRKKSFGSSPRPHLINSIIFITLSPYAHKMTCKNMAEKADYLQIGGSNTNRKNKGLCLGAGVLPIGGEGHKHFFHIFRFFSSGMWGWGGRKLFLYIS